MQLIQEVTNVIRMTCQVEFYKKSLPYSASNGSVYAVGAGVGVSTNSAAVGGAVGILNVNKNSELNVTNSSIDSAKTLSVKNIDGGTSALNTYQGSAGALARNVSYSKLKSSGVDNLKISGSNLKAVENIHIENADNSNTEIKSVGIAAGLGAGGVLIAEGDVSNNNKITIANGTNLTSEKDSIDVRSYSGNGDKSLQIETVSKSGGVLFAGAGIVAVGKGSSTAEIDIDKNISINAAKNIGISANNSLNVETKTSADSSSLLEAESKTYLENSLATSSKIHIDNDTTLNSDFVTVESLVNPTQILDMTSLSVGTAGIGVSSGKVNTNTTNNVDIGNITLKDGADVKIINSTSPTQTASVAGLNAGVIASDTQAVKAQNNFNASTKLGGTSSNADIAVVANIIAKPTVTANGEAAGWLTSVLTRQESITIQQ